MHGWTCKRARDDGWRDPARNLSPFRSMGGRFKIGSPNYAPYVRNFYDYTLRAMEKTSCPGGLVIVTYHYSDGDTLRGCTGFNYDTKAARAYTAKLVEDYNRVYGSLHKVEHILHMGIETDRESFVFHGHILGVVINIADTLAWSVEKLRAEMRGMYPEMPEVIFNDLMPFAIGN